MVMTSTSKWRRFRVVKTEIGFSHFEGRSYIGLMRHMILCQLVMTFVAEQTNRLSLSPVELVAKIIQYHQARNLAAKKSRLKGCHETT